MDRRFLVILLGAAIAGVLLGIATIETYGTWTPARAGNAGEWFAGIAAAAILAWTVAEPGRQAARDAKLAEQQRDLSAAEAIIRSITKTRFRPRESTTSTSTSVLRDLYDDLEIEGQVLADPIARARVRVALAFVGKVYRSEKEGIVLVR